MVLEISCKRKKMCLPLIGSSLCKYFVLKRDSAPISLNLPFFSPKLSACKSTKRYTTWLSPFAYEKHSWGLRATTSPLQPSSDGKLATCFWVAVFFCVYVRVISNLEEFMKPVPPTSSVHRWGCNPWWKTCFYNFLSFPAATVGALTEAIKTVCSDNGCMNVFRGGSLELDGVICRFVCLVFYVSLLYYYVLFSDLFWRGSFKETGPVAIFKYSTLHPFWDIYFFFQDSCGAALSLGKKII